MGSDERTDSDIEADAFFDKWAHPTIEQFEAVWGEQYVSLNLERVAAEDKAFGYWRQRVTGQAERRAQRELAATKRRQEQDERLQRMRIAPATVAATEQPQVVLPAPRIVVLTDAERTETDRWWARLARREGTRTLAWRIRGEVFTARADDRFQARATKAWQQEQRAFERAQWLAVTKGGRARRKVEQRWVAISEDRALEIALAALEHRTPPQGQK